METPQLNALPPECSQSCHGFVRTFNDAMERLTGTEMVTDVTDKIEAAGTLRAVIEERFHGPEIGVVIAEQTGAVAINNVSRLENPVADINAMDAISNCADNGCRLVRSALLLNLPKYT